MAQKETNVIMANSSLEANLKRCGTINETNIVMFNAEDKIQKYKSMVNIIEEFAQVLLKYFDFRGKYLLNKLTLERDLSSNRARFILIIQNKLHISNRK